MVVKKLTFAALAAVLVVASACGDDDSGSDAGGGGGGSEDATAGGVDAAAGGGGGNTDFTLCDPSTIPGGCPIDGPSAECPEAMPNIGSPCSIEELRCPYCVDGSFEAGFSGRLCRSGAWTSFGVACD